jgi:hypothetical protein
MLKFVGDPSGLDPVHASPQVTPQVSAQVEQLFALLGQGSLSQDQQQKLLQLKD